MVEELKKTRNVYHYTSIETLFAILECYRKDMKKENLFFRASNIYKLNDPKEMEVGYDMVKFFLSEYEKKEIPKVYWLYDISNNKKNEQKCKEDYIIGEKNYIIGTGFVPYTISFSARRDYLPMWSLYGKSGNGVCLKFDAYNMIKNISDTQVGFVAYNTRSSMRTLNEIIPGMYKMYMDKYKDKHSELSVDNKIRELATICLWVSPYIKFKDYQYEKEFRLTYYKYYGINHDEIINSSIHDLCTLFFDIDSYVETPIAADSLKEVIVGPNMDFNTIGNIIKREINACNLDVIVSKSKVPFQIK